MPNWKSYESSVRLLSAIIAAHPDLKLNYDGKQIEFLALKLYASRRRLTVYLIFLLLP
jgi:hypothetical protein